MIVDGGPSTTDWITAVTAAVALLVAIVAVVPTWRQLRMLVADKDREQAAGFAMWAQYSPAARELQILYANSGAVPVYDVRGKTTVGEGKRPTTFDRGTIGPTAEPFVDRTITKLVNGEITAQVRERFGERADREDADGEPDPPADVLLARSDLGKSVRVAVSFRDAAGVTWQRTPDGRLTKEPQRNRFRRLWSRWVHGRAGQG